MANKDNKESKNNRIYNHALFHKPIDPKAVLIEAGQGKNVNGNAFALLRQIHNDPRFAGFSLFFALVPEKFEEAEKKFIKYGLDRVTLVKRGEKEYLIALATSKYLITDNSFPAYFYKREGQIYLNTWHGTPLKVLGRSDLKNAVSIGNVQANMVKADYLLFPNAFTKEIMMKDFMVDKVFSHTTLISDYPRNDALHNNRFRSEIRARYGLEGKRIIAYMPTWRGNGRNIDVDAEVSRTEEAINDICAGMNPDDVLYINLHFLLGSTMDLPDDKVRMFPEEYETYDFLSACDVLISDYSSVTIDFAETGRDIILYFYDYDQYKSDKGFYYDPVKLPFKKAYNRTELAAQLKAEKPVYQLPKEMKTANKGKSSGKILDLIFHNNRSGLQVEDYSKKKRESRIAYFENITKEDSFRKLMDYIADLSEEDRKKTIIMFPDFLRQETISRLKLLPEDIDFVKVSGTMYCSSMERTILSLFKRYGLFRNRADRIYRREAGRQIGQFKTDRFTVQLPGGKDRSSILSRIGSNNR